MLRELSIRNLAVIEEVRVCFHNGFHVLTGETGAGKSILIDALSLLIGEEAPRIWCAMDVIKRRWRRYSSFLKVILYGK